LLYELLKTEEQLNDVDEVLDGRFKEPEKLGIYTKRPGGGFFFLILQRIIGDPDRGELQIHGTGS